MQNTHSLCLFLHSLVELVTNRHHNEYIDAQNGRPQAVDFFCPDPLSPARDPVDPGFKAQKLFLPGRLGQERFKPLE